MVLYTCLMEFRNTRETWTTYYTYRFTETDGFQLMVEYPSDHNHLRDSVVEKWGWSPKFVR